MRRSWIAGIALLGPLAGGAQAVASTGVVDYAAYYTTNGLAPCFPTHVSSQTTATSVCPTTATSAGSGSASATADLPSRSMSATSTFSLSSSQDIAGCASDPNYAYCLTGAGASGEEDGIINTVGHLGTGQNPIALVFTYALAQSHSLTGAADYGLDGTQNWAVSGVDLRLYASQGNSNVVDGVSLSTNNSGSNPHVLYGSTHESGTGNNITETVFVPYSAFAGAYVFQWFIGANIQMQSQIAGATGAAFINATLAGVDAVNANGKVVGTVQFNNQGNGTLTLTGAPEPSSFLLLGTGLVGLVPVVRRKRTAPEFRPTLD